MKFSFSQFILDTNKQQLLVDGKIISLTQQIYKLLLLFIESDNKALSKKYLIEKIWHDSFVTENSLDQIVSKLRKILNSVHKNTYIKTDYGKGFIFIPVVKPLKPDSQSKIKSIQLILSIIVISLIITTVGYYNEPNSTKNHNPLVLPQLLIIPSDKEKIDEENDSDAQWLNNASVTIMEQILNYSNNVHLKDIFKKPKYLNDQQYINNQWKINPHLKVITTHFGQENNRYTVTINVIDRLQKYNTQSFSDQNLAIAIKYASEWLNTQINKSNPNNKIDSLIPDNSYLIELYMRGLDSYSKGEFKKAENLFQLCVQESPSFHLARLQLAKVKSALGKQEKALAIIDTLAEINVFPQMEIDIQSVRGMIYNIQGKDELNKNLYLSIIGNYPNHKSPQLNQIKYNLSFTYTKLTEYDKALEILKNLELSLSDNSDSEMLANVLHKQASILQKLGHIDIAKISAEKSLVLFAKLNDLLGEAKVHTTLARIATHQAHYTESLQQLEQSLNICKSLNYQLGIGATLNEMIYIYMVQGQFSLAWQANLEMQKIAIDIDYNAMLQTSKQFSTDISRLKKQWVKSEIYLHEHLQLAQDSNNQSALLKNKLLALDLYLDQGKTKNDMKLIKEVQKHINTSQEIRLQPRLNKQLARYYILTKQQKRGITLLIASKKLAQETKDGETLIEINNLLAEQYLIQNQPQKALSVLEESLNFKPLPYPYLLIKSKANLQLGHHLVALDLANECKNISNEWWSLDDERFLSTLKEKSINSNA